MKHGIDIMLVLVWEKACFAFLTLITGLAFEHVST